MEANKKYNITLAEISRLLRENNERQIIAMFKELDFHVIADVLVDIEKDRRRLFMLLQPEIQAEVMLLLEKQTKKRLLRRLQNSVIARFLHFTDEDDAADVMQLLPEIRQKEISDQLHESKRMKIHQLLEFNPDTAGGIMDLNFIIVKTTYSYRDVLDKITRHIERTKEVPVVIVTDELNQVKGVAPFRNLIGISPETSVQQILHRAPTVEYTLDQEALIKRLKSTRQDMLIVIDKNHHPIGIIHPQDLLKVMEEEATEDLYKFAGVDHEEDVFDTPQLSVRYRYKWLLINLGTALLASFVITLFEETISTLVILAAYMPVVAGMGGNAGTQTLAVVVRGIALGEVRLQNGMRIIKKEIIAGLFNGLIVGVTIAFLVTLLHNDYRLGIILGLSLVANLVIAGIFGAIIPLTLKSLKLDPALSSSVFITTATDVFGFLVFLGLATAFLL